MRVLNDNILVRVNEDKGEKISSGGIYLAESSTKNDPALRGVVVGMGPGTLLQDGKRIPMDIQVGETVIFAKHKSLMVEENGEKFYVVAEAAVLAVS